MTQRKIIFVMQKIIQNKAKIEAQQREKEIICKSDHGENSTKVWANVKTESILEIQMINIHSSSQQCHT